MLKNKLQHLEEHAEEQCLRESPDYAPEIKAKRKNEIIYTQIVECVEHHSSII